MEVQDALAFAFQRADATQTFWNIFATVATAIPAFLAAVKADWINRMLCAVLTAGFLVFAVANFAALDQVRTQRAALIQLIPRLDNYDPKLDEVIQSARPPSAGGLRLFHAALDGVVVALIWVIPYVRGRSAAASGS